MYYIGTDIISYKLLRKPISVFLNRPSHKLIHDRIDISRSALCLIWTYKIAHDLRSPVVIVGTQIAFPVTLIIWTTASSIGKVLSSTEYIAFINAVQLAIVTSDVNVSEIVPSRISRLFFKNLGFYLAKYYK